MALSEPSGHPPRELRGSGTPEQAWRDAGVLDALPRQTPGCVRPARRAVVVAPHPDDETLGLGGSLAAWAATGLPVVLVAVTAGEGSHPDSPTLTPATLATRRHDERARALRCLGLADATVVELGIPDGEVTLHRHRLQGHLTDLLEPGDTVIAPLAGDGHPDHDAAAGAARRAAEARGAALLGYAVWLWHWAAPDEPGIDWSSATRVALPEWCHRAKWAAVGCFDTQIAALSDDPRDAPVLPAPVLARLVREVEVLWGAR